MTTSTWMARGRLLRAFPWPEVCLTTGGAAAAFTLAVAVLPSAAGFRLLLLSLALCGGAAAYVLDEAAGPVVDATPMLRRWRLGCRLFVVALPASVGVAGLAAAGRSDPTLLWHRLGLVLVGYLAIGVAVAAVLRHNGRPTPGDLAAVLVATATFLVTMVNPLHRWVALLPFGSEVEWGRTAALWSGIITVSAVTLLVSMRDPVARTLVRPRKLRAVTGAAVPNHRSLPVGELTRD